MAMIDNVFIVCGDLVFVLFFGESNGRVGDVRTGPDTPAHCSTPPIRVACVSLEHNSVMMRTASQAEDGDHEGQRHQRRARPLRLPRCDQQKADFVLHFHILPFGLLFRCVAANGGFACQ
jgi:hypothetical protein